jgi:hypothetical protein
VAGDGEDLGAVAEVELVAVADLDVHRDGWGFAPIRWLRPFRCGLTGMPERRTATRGALWRYS